MTLLACAFAALSAQAQNLIVNGSFELPQLAPKSDATLTPTSWQQATSPPALINGDPRSGYPLARDAEQYISIGVEDDGRRNGVSQSFAVTSAGTYRLAWYDTTPIGYGTSSPYSISVLAGGTNTVASTNLDAYTGTVSWVSHSMLMTLSPGEYVLQIQAEPPIGHVASCIDGVSIEAYDSDLLTTIRCSAVDVCWQGRTNHMYQVQYRTDVSGTNWFNLGSPVPGSGTNCVTDSISGMERRFYQIVRLP